MKRKYLSLAVAVLAGVALSMFSGCGGGSSASSGGSSGSSGGSSGGGSGGGVGNVFGQIKLVSTGWHHTCAVIEENGESDVKCWGSNLHGELGDGTRQDSTVPKTVFVKSGQPLTGVKEVSASRYYTCALMNDGTVKCWGWNEGGKLGNGKLDHVFLTQLFPSLSSQQLPYPNQVDSLYPTDVMVDQNTKLTNVKQISAGSWHACALRNDGTVWCWGQNLDGALGIGQDFSNIDPSNPDWSVLISPYAVQVKDPRNPTGYLHNVIQVAAGSSDHTCALIDSDGDGQGTIRCWAWNGQLEGQLGNNDTTHDYVTEPSGEVVDENGNIVSNAIQLAIGGDHTCALLSTSEVVCWGMNDTGQIGDNTTTDAPVAHKVVFSDGRVLRGVKSIASERGNHVCAITNDGSVYCWGDNTHGQIGNGSSEPYIPYAVRVTRLPESVKFLAAGGGGRSPVSDPHTMLTAGPDYDGDHTCAITASGDLYCWGSNDHGQLGDGTTTDRSTPVKVQF